MTIEREFLPFALPDIGEEEINEVVDTLRSGWITTGPKVQRFEADFAAYLGGNVEVVSVNSATAGLHLALEAIGVGPDDEVIVPTYTFTASAEVVRYLGAEPVIVDVDPVTLNVTAETIAQAVGPRTKAVVIVHIGGLPCDMSAILALADKLGIAVIEDAAHALPSRHRGELVGTLNSTATVFSFYANKTMTTAEGGMVVTRRRDIAQRCRIMRLHGISRDSFDRYISRQPAWHYEVIAPGFKYNLTDIAASLGIHQLRKVEAFRDRRQQIADYYRETLGNLPLILPAEASSSGDVHSWHLYIVRLRERLSDRDSFIQRLFSEGIGCSVHYIPLHLHPYWRDRYQLSPEKFPNATLAYRGAVSLPIYTRMRDEDVERVVEVVRRSLP